MGEQKTQDDYRDLRDWAQAHAPANQQAPGSPIAERVLKLLRDFDAQQATLRAVAAGDVTRDDLLFFGK